MNLSQHLTLAETIKSNTAKRLGIDNTPTDDHVSNLRALALHIFEPLRQHFNVAIGISSGYRSPKLSKAIGSKSTSQHCNGQALDIDADIYGKLKNIDIYNYIKNNLDFDQLIGEFPNELGEFSWVHVSYKSPELNRGEVLIANKVNGKTVYTKQ